MLKINRLRKIIPCGILAILAGFTVSLFFGCASSTAGKANPEAAWWIKDARQAESHEGIIKTSRYLTMRDGVRIAVDLYLPGDLRPGEKIPAILTQTRYFRAFHFYWPTRSIIGVSEEIKKIVGHGYAFVRTDVRGTGASFGTQPNPWPPDAIRDGAQIVDWIISQPWSNGKVGAAGGSYEGATAEFLLLNRHPAVKAIAPMFAPYDVYTDIAFPGGIHLSWFTRVWGRGNHAMDSNRLREVAWYAPLFTRGVMPVDGDRDRKLLEAAVAEHVANPDIHAEASQLTFRDDISKSGFNVDSFSPHAFREDIRASGVPIYNYSGYYDGGYTHAAIKRFLTNHGAKDKLILGAWDHGGDHHPKQFGKTEKSGFDHIGEVLRFFDYHLKGIDTGIYNEPPVHYYTMGEEKWKASKLWPPEGANPTSFYFREGKSLLTEAPASAGEDEYHVVLTAGTGDKTRWNCLAGGVDVGYPDRVKKDEKLLVYQTPPLPRDTEVTGHPVVTLFVRSTASDGEFFAYLEDVDEKGRVGYVTEGMLRALHRKLSDDPPPYVSPVPYRSFLRKDALPLVPGETAEIAFDLLPVSYLFKAGHRIRIAIAGADADHFATLPGDPPLIHIERSHEHASRIVLPVMESRR